MKNDTTEVLAKVTEITSEVIKYKKFENLDGPIYHMNKTEVFQIIFENGFVESLTISEDVLDERLDTLTNFSFRDLWSRTFSLNKENADKNEVPNEKVGDYEEKEGLQERTVIALNYASATSVGGSSYPVLGYKMAYEYLFPNHPDQGNSKLGYGLQYNLLMMYRYDLGPSERYEGDKHFVGFYLFKEYDVKDIFFVGLSGGPVLNYNVVRARSTNAVNPGRSSRSFGTGIQTGQYIQKYIKRNPEGEWKNFLRMGFDQYFATRNGFGGSIYLAYGF